ncbi:MAG: cupin domain-containing protein [Methylococcales bacterium]|nr:cupin domain-containing protein [Methylococcales bacterium]
MAKKEKTLTTILPEELVGAIAEKITPITLPSTKASELKSRVMARIRGKKEFDLMTIRAEDGEWITLLPGIEKKILSNYEEGKLQSYLLRMAPGSSLPSHDHIVDEESIMLEGEATICDIHLSAGDYHFAPKGSKHGEVFSQNGCLVFVKTF